VSASTNTVTRLSAEDGTYRATYAVESYPVGAVFDGTSVWVANAGSNTVDKITRTPP
jgi:hypothetical protein